MFTTCSSNLKVHQCCCQRLSFVEFACNNAERDQAISQFNIMLAIYISLALANLQNLSWFLLANAPYQDISAVRLTVESDGCALQ
ncbi:hypothetical protein T4C_10064 [Trichinella pseudospiralis]|uniref:Uncharacterized protein n=1 Tax=Trichinella pseudospiralis TaxID=6337 RepID=A0A0V1JX55_TRIPS|nr:hypothetical protein T4C_10064 [Trichinella pseudospiralis]